MLADELDYVIGVDTHRDEHVFAVVAARTGVVLAQHSVGAERRGYEAALRFARRCAPGARVWAVEGTGHYGAGLTRFLAARGETAL
jgi:transposase